MPEERLQPAQLEPICIRTTQVYDWCYLNGTTSVLLPDIVFPADTSVVAGIEAAIISVECAEIDRDQDPSGLANVTIRRLVTFELTFVDVNGNPVPVIVNGVEVTTQTRSRFFDEFIRVCAPEGTTLTCEITDAAARAFMTAINSTPAVQVELFVCQNIQVTADVTVSININDYCLPDACQPGQKPFQCPPPTTPPPACGPLTQGRARKAGSSQG